MKYCTLWKKQIQTLPSPWPLRGVRFAHTQDQFKVVNAA
jgi:hypothetical protein